ncbi:hypothetical protein CRI77_14635 [Mycolicibacterium duvalii]|uniref:Uncharacterized protein n=1 Tax=Mycolicibacterium duvalii TaxID=39688 RepID=A0A7I7K7H4_9MYCO|nr:hypothetical protein [Mycolicibacterium duvalii]MCV7366044.1 hypothetical protein [Mycolicibacterium duvalii]PEG40115.1 hypothetical protein CRI77_14635 [Mycolicibacterium duvalii]BBX19489.1 hypothetical protein MDUV_43490 [Mycolicibacterium duvalii]
MKRFGIAGVVAAALYAAVLGFAGPAQADDDGYRFGGDRGDGWSWGYGYGYNRDDRNNPWLDQLFPSVKVPQVDTSVRN